ncbi:major facilitator superfamily domain-containing protein [Zychaea mexicana]|uniref:major facilitator superfamily domain-containing protein n=1 Tax=Zychaea mexicana TaxID=64656 RepID=UPI0022FE11B8|nr:major facilitator superfamily domain-containing protein [Zychaea mexicana]KAI9493747.1 major facilitator superfamily domain-containing protein [Zychaea mexicana]
MVTSRLAFVYSAQMSTWLHSAYALCTLITMPAASALSNAFGRKPVLITLNMLFLIGSLGCGFARSFEHVVVARAIAGFGGGGIALMGNIILHDIVSRDQLGSYLAYLSMCSMLGFGLGAPIGGFITDYFGWRYCFKINILPMTLILCIYTFRLRNYSVSQNQKAVLTTREKLKTVDFGGILLLSGANTSLTCALWFGGTSYSWCSPQIILALVSTLIGYILFLIHERRWAVYPLLSRVASRDRNFTTSCVCIFLPAACEGAALTVLPQFLMASIPGVLHFKTSKAGLWVMMNAASVPVGTFIAGRYMHYTGRFKRFVSVAMTSYIIAVAIFYNWAGGNVSKNLGTMGIVLEGASYGCISVCIIVACTSTLSKELAATSLSICTLVRFVGYLIGAAVVSSIVQYTLITELPTRIEGEDAEKVYLQMTTDLNVES